MEITTFTLARALLLLKRFILLDPFNLSGLNVSKKTREGICSLQLKTADYQFSLSQAHKKFKECDLSDNKKREYFDQLEKLAESGFKSFTDLVVAVLQEYFRETRYLDIDPRIGVHLFPEKGGDLVNILNPSKKKIKDYTVFVETIKGKPYLDNCIPLNAKKKDYFHAGMNNQRLQNYEFKYILDSYFISRLRNAWSRVPKIDKEWVAVSKDGDANSFYKSHVAVPITFLKHKNQLNDDFAKIINLDNNHNRSILGLILVDHERPYYFDNNNVDGLKNVDVNVLVIFADILSFAFVAKLTYYDKSLTVNEFKKNAKCHPTKKI